MKNKFRVGIVICLVILLSGFPQILTQQASGILGGPKKFKGGEFIGEASVRDVQDGEYQGDIHAYAFHKVAVVSYDVGFVTCRAPYLLHTEETHGLPVEFRLKLEFPEFPREANKIVPIYGSHQTRTGALSVQHGLRSLKRHSRPKAVGHTLSLAGRKTRSTGYSNFSVKKA